MHDLISAIDSSILSVDCVEWLNILQQIVQQLFAQLLSFLCHNTSRNSFGCPVIGREMLATGFPNDCCLLVILRRSTCWFSSSQRASAESLARRQNAVVSTYVNDIVLLSLTPSTICWLHCSSLLIDLPVRRCFCLALLFTTADSFSSTADHSGPLAPADLSSSAEHDVVTDYIIIDGPLRCSSWFSFDVPADPSSSSSACSWFLSFQLINYTPAGSTWPLPDFEQLT
ncbi:hypothetical protein F511_36946 [Dorcoceras hygrometricum]|uniref:Uncharacterized protein n=1 Tax=Dorcoceras hygrometricum TaxID=472368 RepID=A0A2Z7BKL9_9LAMI|nr:hypothetical protein F511_36946 [Dorcoceras hygrometricum]